VRGSAPDRPAPPAIPCLFRVVGLAFDGWQPTGGCFWRLSAVGPALSLPAFARCRLGERCGGDGHEHRSTGGPGGVGASTTQGRLSNLSDLDVATSRGCCDPGAPLGSCGDNRCCRRHWWPDVRWDTDRCGRPWTASRLFCGRPPTGQAPGLVDPPGKGRSRTRRCWCCLALGAPRGGAGDIHWCCTRLDGATL